MLKRFGEFRFILALAKILKRERHSLGPGWMVAAGIGVEECSEKVRLGAQNESYVAWWPAVSLGDASQVVSPNNFSPACNCNLRYHISIKYPHDEASRLHQYDFDLAKQLIGIFKNMQDAVSRGCNKSPWLFLPA